MSNDRPEDKASRVEQVLETGDLQKAMDTLIKEVQDLNPQDRAAVLKSLDEQNKAANAKDSSLPNVTLTEETSLPLGFGDKTGRVDVSMDQSGLEKIAAFFSGNYEAAKAKEPYTNVIDTYKKMNGADK